MDIALLVLLFIVLLVVAYSFSTYNRFKSLKNAGDATLAQVRVAMKKRLDMIEQLVEAVKSYLESQFPFL